MQESIPAEPDAHVESFWNVLRNRYAIILLTLLLVLGTTVVITEALPEQYVATAEIQVQKGDPGEVFRGSGIGRELGNFRFHETQFEIITSKHTLYRVVDELGLIERWGIPSRDRNQAFQRLRGMVDARSKQNTELIEIEVYADEPELAADIANAIVRNYEERRNEIRKKVSDRIIRELENQLTAAEATSANHHRQWINIMEKTGIVDRRIGRTSGGSGLSEVDDGRMDEIDRQARFVHEFEKDIATLEIHIEALTGLEGEELVRRAAGLDIGDSGLRDDFRQYREMERQEQGLLDSGLGPNHPELVRVRNQINKLGEQLAESATSYQKGLQMRLGIAQQGLEKAKGSAEVSKVKAIAGSGEHAEYDAARNRYEISRELSTGIKTKLAMQRVTDSLPIDPIEVHATAEPNFVPAKPHKWMNCILGGVMGLLLGLGLAFFLEFSDTSVRSIAEVESYLGVPVLAVVPSDVGLLHQQAGTSPDAEAYRILRTNIEFNRKSEKLNAISVVSSGAGEGKSTTLMNLSYICAQGGYTTLLIDADLRRPSLHRMFGIDNRVGLTNYLSNSEAELEEVVLQTPVDNLFFLPSGVLPADGAGILHSRRMTELMQDVKNRFDLVLVDSPPILGVSDASVIANEVDHSIIVVQYRKVPRKVLARMKQALESVGANVLGAVLNNVDLRSDSLYEYYTSYYTYYSPEKGGTFFQETETFQSPAEKDTAEKEGEIY